MYDDIYILIPVYNEETTILKVINDLKPKFKNILVVDDGSTDSTYQIIKNTNVDILRHSINLGQGAALSNGFEHLKNKKNIFAIITFDGDGQHLCEDAEIFAREILQCKEEIIFGSRFLMHKKNIPLKKRFILNIAILFTKFASGISLSDTHNGLIALKKSCLRNINITIDGFGHASEIRHIVSKKNISYKELPSNIQYTKYSMSKGQKISNSFLILEDFFISLFRK